MGTDPDAIVAGDFNGDGRTDLAVANYGSNDVSVLLGNGDGTFQTQVTYAVGTGPDAIVAGDFNGDGRTDLAVANYGSNDVSVLLGNGDGTFQPQVTYAVGTEPDALVAGDFNGDGRTDLAVANYGSNDVSVLLGNGDGTFQPQVTYAVGTGPVALVAGDFNGDGRTDLAVANYGSNDVSVLLGNGDGTFQTQVTYAVGSEPDALVAGDFNGDGRTDLAVANVGDNDVSVLLGNGDGTFQPQVTYAVGTEPDALVAGDFNGDGRTDLAVANYGSNDVSVLLSLQRHVRCPRPVCHQPPGHPPRGRPDRRRRRRCPGGQWGRGHPLEKRTAARAGHVRSAHHDQSRPSLAGHRRRGHEPGPGARQRGRHRQRGLVVRLARRQLRPDRVAPHRFAPRADRHGRPQRRRLGRPGGAERGRRHPLGLFQQRLRERRDTAPRPLPVPGDSAGRPRRLGRDPGGCRSATARTDIVVTNKLTGEVGVLRNLGHGVFAPAVLYRAGGGLYAVTNTRRLGDPHDPRGDRGRGRRRVHHGRPARPGGDQPRLQHLQRAERAGRRPFRQPGHPPHGQPGHRGPRRRPRRQWHPGCDRPERQRRDRLSRRRQGRLPARSVHHLRRSRPHRHDRRRHQPRRQARPARRQRLRRSPGAAGQRRRHVPALSQRRTRTWRWRSCPTAAPPPTSSTPTRGSTTWSSITPADRRTWWRDRSSGLLAPGAVALADLNGDGIPDLIVANSGSNNVLVYPGLGNGQFGPELNGGKGFFTGTDPVGHHRRQPQRPARPGRSPTRAPTTSRSCSIEPTADGGFTFVPGPAAPKAATGPTSTGGRGDRPVGDGFPDLLVSDSGSNQVRLLPGVGGGFFNDQNPTIFSVGTSPGPIFVGNFDGKPDLLTVNSGSNDVTVISDFMGSHPVTTPSPPAASTRWRPSNSAPAAALTTWSWPTMVTAPLGCWKGGPMA